MSREKEVDDAVKDEYSNPDISLCKNCWCMTHTLVGNVCGKCKRPKHIIDVIGDENIGGESVSLKEIKNGRNRKDAYA